MKKIRCMTCGNEVENDTHFKCNLCLSKPKKKLCNHTPDKLEYKANCRWCNVPLVAKTWEEE